MKKHSISLMNIVFKHKPELQLQPPDLQSASAQFHAPLNSHGMMVTGVSCQKENLPQREKLQGMRYGNFNITWVAEIQWRAFDTATSALPQQQLSNRDRF